MAMTVAQILRILYNTRHYVIPIYIIIYINLHIYINLYTTNTFAGFPIDTPVRAEKIAHMQNSTALQINKI